MTDAELFAALQQQKALIVHCSRTGKGDEAIGGLFYPDDLKRAIEICSAGTELCCSVIWPTHVETFGPIGIVLRPRSIASVTSICFDDAGSHVDPGTGRRVGFGVRFSSQAVRDTFANATGYNEWNVAHADTIGLFVHPSDPWDVARPMKLSHVPGFDPSLGDGAIVGAVTITLPEIMAAFPGLPIYSLFGGEIVKVEPWDQGARCHAIDPAEFYRRGIVSTKVSQEAANVMAAAQPAIDVWDARTFDSELLAQLEADADLIRAYFQTDHQIFLSHDLGRGPEQSILRPENPHASDFYELLDAIGLQMGTRTIRTFHYTHLTKDEIASLLRSGIHVSTPETLRRRLEAVVVSGELARDVADRLFAESPFHSDQLHARSGKFWLTSHPVAVDDSGVMPLLERWGGEVASMWVRDLALSALLLKLGRARIIEVAVPLGATKHSYDAAKAVVATFARSRGAIPSKFAFDLYVETALPATAVLAVHTKGDAAFESMGRDYPEGFIDVDVGRWKELTGDED